VSKGFAPLYGQFMLQTNDGKIFYVPDFGDILTAVALYRIMRQMALTTLTTQPISMVQLRYWAMEGTFNERDGTFAPVPLDRVHFRAEPDQIIVRID
jgi:hypothetical protein